MGTVNKTDSVFDGLIRGNRRALANALSLVESSHPADKDDAASLLERIALWQRDQQHKPGYRPTNRIGITGSPGVGKSTLIETFGLELIGKGHRIAVLAVDPSSRIRGGSILGDKIRMPKLSIHDEAFVRPLPSKQSYGGVSDSTPDAILVCEAAGFDTIIVETVGVGQSETEVSGLVDLMILLIMPSSGDDIQGIKRGIMEVADVLAVTKMDLDANGARKTAAVYASAYRLMMSSKQEWTAPVIALSSLTPNGLMSFHEVVDTFFAAHRRNEIEKERNIQHRKWFHELLKRSLAHFLSVNKELSDKLVKVSVLVDDGIIPPSAAVYQLLQHLNITISEKP